VTLAADLFLLLGASFMFLGAVGLIRMPDVYNRLQAGTKTVTLGALSILVGVGLQHPGWWSMLLMIAVLVLFTNPVGSASIARAALLAGVRPWQAHDGARPAAAAEKGEAEQ